MISVDKNSRKTQLSVSTAGTALALLIWYIVADVLSVFPDTTLPGPVAIYNRVVETNEIILQNLWPTLMAAGVGFAAAVVLGILTAVILTANERLRGALMPLIVSANSVPRLALAPVIIFYVGGFQAKYLISAWIAFFPMLINAMEGLGDLGEDLDHLLKSLDATTYQEYRKVRLPNSLPFIFDGMKLSVTLAIVGAVVGEYVAADSGMGWLALFALRNLDTELVFGLVGIMGLISVTLFYALFVLQDRLVHWTEASMITE